MITESEMSTRRFLARIGKRLRTLQEETANDMNCHDLRKHLSMVRGELNVIADDVRAHLRGDELLLKTRGDPDGR